MNNSQTSEKPKQTRCHASEIQLFRKHDNEAIVMLVEGLNTETAYWLLKLSTIPENSEDNLS